MNGDNILAKQSAINKTQQNHGFCYYDCTAEANKKIDWIK